LSEQDLLAIKGFSTVYMNEYGPDGSSEEPGLGPIDNSLRVAEVTASNGIFSKSIRAVLERQVPKADAAGDDDNPRQGMFSSAGMFANTMLSLDGNVTAQIHPWTTPLPGYSQPARGVDNPDNPATPAEDPSKNYRLDLQTNSYAEIKNGAKIQGNLVISNSSSSATSEVGSAQDGTQIY
jgi:hypothetical protein